ncbi:MAG: hypothetical protein U0V73_01930 [Acidimicrobiia bacterium]
MLGKRRRTNREHDLPTGASLADVRGQSLSEILEEYVPAERTDVPATPPRGRSQRYIQDTDRR